MISHHSLSKSIFKVLNFLSPCLDFRSSAFKAEFPRITLMKIPHELATWVPKWTLSWVLLASAYLKALHFLHTNHLPHHWFSPNLIFVVLSFQSFAWRSSLLNQLFDAEGASFIASQLHSKAMWYLVLSPLLALQRNWLRSLQPNSSEQFEGLKTPVRFQGFKLSLMTLRKCCPLRMNLSVSLKSLLASFLRPIFLSTNPSTLWVECRTLP